MRGELLAWGNYLEILIALVEIVDPLWITAR
jgi:hypothetical protein